MAGTSRLRASDSESIVNAGLRRDTRSLGHYSRTNTDVLGGGLSYSRGDSLGVINPNAGLPVEMSPKHLE